MHIISGEIVYDVGDRVVITRKHLRGGLYKTGHGDNDLWWNCEMNKFCGITATISSVTGRHNYRIVEDEGRWVWCNTFFEKMCDLDLDNDEEIAAPNISKFLGSFYVNS